MPKVRKKNLCNLNDLLDKVVNPFILGRVFAEVYNELFIEAVDLAKKHRNGSDFIGGMVHYNYKSQGEAWLYEILKDKTFSDNSLRVGVYWALRQEKNIFNMLEKEHETIQEKFWKNIKNFYPEGGQEIIYSITKFLEFKCLLKALPLIINAESNLKISLPTELYMKVLDELLSHDFNHNSEEIDITMFDYYLKTILKELGGRDNVDKTKLFLVEWRFFSLFQGRDRPENLFNQINQEPAFFIQLLTYAYPCADATVNQEITFKAHQVLYEKKSLPGIAKDGHFDGESFQKWFLEARSLASEYKLTQEFDFIVGRWIAYAPSDPKGAGWPHELVKNIFEQYSTEALESGFSAGLIESRGISVKLLGEGGNQERELAKRYDEYAKISEIRWPKIANILRETSDKYKVEAERADLTALDD